MGKFSKKKRKPRVADPTKPAIPFAPGELVNAKLLPRRTKKTGPFWEAYGDAIAIPGGQMFVRIRGERDPSPPPTAYDHLPLNDNDNQWEDIPIIDQHQIEEAPVNHVVDFGDYYGNEDRNAERERRRIQNQKAKEKQTSVWLTEVLPRLIGIHMKERSQRSRFRERGRPPSICQCHNPQQISVILMLWSSMCGAIHLLNT